MACWSLIMSHFRKSSNICYSVGHQIKDHELSWSYSRLRLYCIISNLGKTSRIHAILLSFLVKYIYMYFFLSRRISDIFSSYLLFSFEQVDRSRITKIKIIIYNKVINTIVEWLKRHPRTWPTTNISLLGTDTSVKSSWLSYFYGFKPPL